MRIASLTAAVSGLAILGAGASLAGGLNEPVAEPVVQPAPTAAPGFDWSGGYVGLQFGAVDSDIDSNVGLFEDDFEFGKNAEGSEIGIYGGYNWHETGPWVFGVDAEYNAVDADDDATVEVGVIGQGGTVEGTAEATIDATAALRGRVGYAWDRALFYGTAGAAYVDYEVDTQIDGESDGTSADNWGWTLGAGVEYAFTDRWIGRVDYRYSDYDGDDGSWYEGDADYEIDLQTRELRVGVAYRF